MRVRELTPCQLELLAALHGGLELKEAASSVGLSYQSAKQYMYNIRGRLALSTSFAVGAWYERHLRNKPHVISYSDLAKRGAELGLTS